MISGGRMNKLKTPFLFTNVSENKHQSQQEQNLVWDQVDAVLVINLPTRADRWQHFLDKNAALLPMQKVHRVDAILGVGLPGYGEEPWFRERTQNRARVWGGLGGCILSHAKALEMIQKKGWRNALILEDDAELSSMDELGVLPRMLQHLRSSYFLYLGYHSVRPYGSKQVESAGRELWRVEGVLTAHAYIVSAEAAQAVLTMFPNRSGIWEWMAQYRGPDTFYRDYLSSVLGVGVYVIWPVLAVQGSIASDIATAEGGSGTHPTFVSNRPTPYLSLRGICHLILWPYRRLKVRLNAMRTLLRARSHGLPGYTPDHEEHS